MPPLIDSQAEAPTCAVCNRDAGAGYYDDREEQYYCSAVCFDEWADTNNAVVAEFYWSMNIQ